jgi:ankyrin repeat protein
MNQQLIAELLNASENGHLEVVERILQDSKVDPWGLYNQAIKSASSNGHLSVVERLLQDPRVDPSADNNMTLQHACYSGHIAVVERLLQDPRVDPSNNNLSIQLAAENSHLAIFTLLLQDPRVDVHKLDPNKISLLSIERIILLNLALPFPADSKLKHFESVVREQRQEFIDIVSERTVYNNTDTYGIHREVWKYIVFPYLE